MSTSNPQLRLVADDGDGPTIAMDPLVGRVLDGRYQIEGVLGEGGMGLVYKAKHTALGKTLAVKVLRAEVSRDSEIVTRFRQEAQSATSIGNEHIIDISDFGALPDGSTYFVMEFLDGLSLTKVIEADRPIPTPRAVHIAKQICNGLGAAHERGIVHRDLKPDNIYLVSRSHDKDFIKVLDFGIAKVGGATSKLTRAGQVFGTPHYMSPEQCAGTEVDHRTDIYALGVILYEMTCGRVPFDADNLMGILTKHLYENPIPPRELPPPTDVTPALEAVIMKCLAKKPEQRYQTMAEMREDLLRIEGGATPIAVLDAVNRGSQTGRIDHTGRATGLGIGDPDAVADGAQKKKLPLAAIVGVVVVLGGVGGYFAFKGAAEPATTPVQTAPPAARQEPVAPPTTPTPTPVAVAAAPSVVMLASDPPGASVFQGSELLGTTPVRIERPAEMATMSVELRLEGYTAQAFRISSLTNSDVTVPLSRARAAPSGGSRHGGGGAAGHGGGAAAAPANPPANEAGGTPPAHRPGRQGSSEVLNPWDE